MQRGDQKTREDSVVHNSLVFVNITKFKRAQRIVALVEGATAVTDAEQETKERFSERLAGIEAKDRLEYVYDVLGGLILTQAEDKVRKSKAEQLKKKGKKDIMGLNKS